MEVAPQWWASSIGLTNRVQPYCRLATAIMATRPAANWAQRLRSVPVAGEAAADADPDPDKTAIRTSRDVYAVPELRQLEWPDGPTYLPHYCRCKSLLMGCQHPLRGCPHRFARSLADLGKGPFSVAARRQRR